MDPKMVQALKGMPSSAPTGDEPEVEETAGLADALEGRVNSIQGALDALNNGDPEGALTVLQDLQALLSRAINEISEEVGMMGGGEEEDEDEDVDAMDLEGRVEDLEE